MIEFVILCGIIFLLLCFVQSKVYPLQRSQPIDPYSDDWLSVAETGDDYRDDTSLRGVLSECFYCSTTILHDGDGEDFENLIPEVHCEDCTGAATRNLCG